MDLRTHNVNSEVFGRDFVWKSNTTIDPADPTTLTYDEFIAAAESNKRNRGKPVDWERTPDLYNFKILSRGQNAAADKVLDWLVSPFMHKHIKSRLIKATGDGSQRRPRKGVLVQIGALFPSR